MGRPNCRCFTNEFRWSNFLLGHNHPGRFVRSQWRGPVWLYLIYRVLVAAYFLSWMVVRLVEENGSEGFRWLLYFSSWSTTLLVSNLLYQVVVVAVYGFCKDKLVAGKKGEDHMPGPLKLLWIWTSAAYSSTILISLLFWNILISPLYAFSSLALVNLQIVSSLYVILDLLITGQPIRLFHFFHGLLFGFAYIVFNLTYFLAGGTGDHGLNVIYVFLDWETPGVATIFSLIFLAFFLAIWIILWLVYRVRMCLVYCLPCGVGSKSEDDSEEEEIIKKDDNPESGTIGKDNYGATDDSSPKVQEDGGSTGDSSSPVEETSTPISTP